ncbi:MAG: alpha-E domain-containing protein [Nitrospira sp.]|nr:alpha-E domain-containing protein [Nitrospira sp.]
MLNQYFPRSVRFCTRGLRQHIERLMDKSPRVSNREPARLIGQLAADLDFVTLEEVHEIGLESFLTEVLRQLDRITTAVSRTYFRSEDSHDVRISSPRRHLRFEHHEAVVHDVKALLSASIQFTYTYEAPSRTFGPSCVWPQISTTVASDVLMFGGIWTHRQIIGTTPMRLEI